jgi:hypothetical protein
VTRIFVTIAEEWYEMPKRRIHVLNTALFHPAPDGLPVAIRPPRGSKEIHQALERCDWNSLGKAPSGELLRAGALWLHGFLDESHSVAQGIDSAEGSYWHALMHRSEGDFSNSKYWYRRVGRHAIFPDLLAAARKLETNSQTGMVVLFKSPDWDPFRFVDIVEQAASRESKDIGLLQAVAREEYNLLMGYCLARSSRTSEVV